MLPFLSLEKIMKSFFSLRSKEKWQVKPKVIKSAPIKTKGKEYCRVVPFIVAENLDVFLELRQLNRTTRSPIREARETKRLILL